ncbi:phosphotransferase [Leucothrix arctica]|uniref:phosphotransferase n=1 Tax=Leucothrix arctica TaxID=1481894 RepID=UPI001BAA8881|nr:phosphotransferase [Leucothrix arctica]
MKEVILKATGAEDIFLAETIQSLWSGYGSLDRYGLIGGTGGSVIVKHVRLPKQAQHPRGWNTDKSHLRKLRSYEVESRWYQDWAHRCGEDCRVPKTLALQQQEGEFVIMLEDLDASGYPARKSTVSMVEINACLTWLANFHATFMEENPVGLWEVGTYWHLDTRPDEFAVMEEGELKQAASMLDNALSKAPFQTIVHGDAKLANFCFSSDGAEVAAVDFQYVGGGCGMKDVAYFIGSCLDEDECEQMEAELLDIYFGALKKALLIYYPSIDSLQVEQAWRPLYSVAWTDFYRFLKGWSPNHWKIHSYSERLAQQVVKSLML